MKITKRKQTHDVTLTPYVIINNQGNLNYILVFSNILYNIENWRNIRTMVFFCYTNQYVVKLIGMQKLVQYY